MVSCFVSLWMAATLGQAPAGESAWLKSVPADAAAVVRVKALESARDDLMKMLEAMSGNAAALAKPKLDEGLQMIEAMHGKATVQHPMLAVFRMPRDGAPVPPWAVLIESDNYLGTLKGVSRKEDLAPKSLGGYDSFEGADGQTWYAFKGTGFVAFGQDEALIKAISKPQASLAEKISDDLKSGLLGGDLGLYVNVSMLQAQYAEQIEGGRQMLMGLIDQGAAQLPGNMAETAKTVYGTMFDAIKVGDNLALSFDFAAEGLTVGGLATVKADSAAGKRLANARTGSAERLGMLPAEASSFTYMVIDPATAEGFQKLTLAMLSGQAKPSPELEKALALQREAGVAETYAAGLGGTSGLNNFSISTPKDPEKAVEAATAISTAIKGGQGMVKDVVVTPKVLSYKGYTFNTAKTTLDLEKMVAPGAPGGTEGLKRMFGGDSITTYYGTDGKSVLTVTAKSPEEAKRLIDIATSGEGGIGKTAGFQALRARLPKDVTAIMLVSAQGIVKQIADQLSATQAKPDIKVPADMPKEAALMGGSVIAGTRGFQFRAVVPSAVGPVVEKGLVPVIQSLQGQIQ